MKGINEVIEMKLDACINQYIEYIKHRKTEGTYDFTKRNLKIVLDFLNDFRIIDSNQLSIDSMYKLIDYLKARGNCNNSINKKIGVFSRALKFNKITIENVTDFKALSFKRKSFNILSESELKKALTYFNRLPKEKPVNLTSYLVFYLLLYTGVRRTELVNIRISDIDFTNSCIHLNHTKTNTPRIVFYKESLNDYIKHYIELKPERKYLFYHFIAKKNLTPEHVTAIFRYAQKQIGLIKFSPHMIRHTMATLLIENGAGISSVQKLLGHASSKTTDIYIHMFVKKMKNEYDNYFPKV